MVRCHSDVPALEMPIDLASSDGDLAHMDFFKIGGEGWQRSLWGPSLPSAGTKGCMYKSKKGMSWTDNAQQSIKS